MKTLIISTGMNVEVLNKILARYGVEVYYNVYEYKEMAFKDETNFKDTFFEVMEFLAKKRIFVTVFDILVQVGKNPKTAKYEKFTNYKHSKYSRLNFLERV